MSKGARKTVTIAYDFYGPLGATAISVFLPLVVYLFAFACNDISGCPTPAVLHPSSLTLEKLKKEVGWPGFSGLINTKATLWTLAYYGLSLVLQVFLPSEEAQGVELQSGGKLIYRFNAFDSAAYTLIVAAIGTFIFGADFPLWTFIWDNYIQLITVNLVIAFTLACFVYVRSFEVKQGNKELRELAAGGHTGNIIYDWFIGRELNPRITLPVLGTIDIKVFCELRPGMLGYILLDLAFIAHQYKLYQQVTDSIILITVFQVFYVLDALFMEHAMLTTIDVTTDGFGFMLAFGDLVWLPFIYSLQARYLAVHPVELGIAGIAGVLAVQGFGYWIFRSANNEKNRFRTNPKHPMVAHLQFIQTKAGSKLLTSGWWGTARHINYLGDWIMGWSYCLPTGIAGYVMTQNNVFSSSTSDSKVLQGEARGWGMLITYFYLLYFAVLLVHREMRDDEKCLRKYGKDWEEYKRKVPYRLVPYIY